MIRGNTFGKLYSITSFGESHGEAIGVTIDGMPAGIEISQDDLQKQLDKRRPGRLKVSTTRSELDKAQVLSGIFEGKTLGTPICIIVKNTNQRSDDYKKIKSNPRPGHADLTTVYKYGIKDHRGGGRASGRETIARVIGGYFASLIISKINVKAIISQIGPYKVSGPHQFLETQSKLGFADQSMDHEIEKYLLDLKSEGNSVGGSVYVHIKNCPKGLGEPVFDKLKAELSHGFLSIGSCMAVEFGRGFEFAQLTGKEISSELSNFGGIEGGISNGEDIYCSLYFKAPSTVGENALEGRHDPCILPRAISVIEAMAKIVLADHYLRQNAYSQNSEI